MNTNLNVIYARTLLLLGVATMSFAPKIYAQDSSTIGPVRASVQILQPTTTEKTSPVRVEPSQGGTVFCPAGFALTKMQAERQQNMQIEVDKECNGPVVTFLGVGMAHVWCKNAPEYYHPVANAPTVNYICQKIENKWVPLSGSKSA